jgi:hypothetical protein
MAARATKPDANTAAAAPKSSRATSKAGLAPPSARTVAARLKAVRKAAEAEAAAPASTARRSSGEWLAAARASLSLSALGAQGAHLRSQAQDSGFRIAGVLVTVGIGWIIGANTFDPKAPSPKVVETMAALATRIDQVEAIARRAEGQDVVGLRASVTSLQANLDASRSQTHTAIIEFSARVEALDRDSAARMLYAARDNAVRFEKLDRDVTARLGEVDKFVMRSAERITKLELRTDPVVGPSPVSFAPPATPRAPMALAPISFPRLRPLAEADAAPLPAETTRVAATQRSANPNRIPVHGYVLRDVRQGVAVLEGRSGLRQVAPGDDIPGAGRVRAIEKRGREWVVVTSVGVIDGKGY